MLTSQNRRTRSVSFRYARTVLVVSVVCTVICLAAVLISFVTFGFTAWLIPALVGGILFALRARRWARAISTARTSPDEYRWTP